jgi:Rha family phage regulatory protein
MTTKNTKKGAGAINTNCLHTDTNSAYSRIARALDQAESKAIANQSSTSLTSGRAALIQVKGQCLLIASNVIANLFGRPHKNVLRDIEMLVEQGAIDRLKLEPISYFDSYSREQRGYRLSERDAMVLAPFLGGRKSAHFQAKLVDEFVRMRAELLRLASRKADPAIQLAKSQKCAASALMTDALVYARSAVGKETKPHHFSNEHRLCNWVLTGSYGHVDDCNLDQQELQLLYEIRTKNAILIANGQSRPERQAALRKAFPLPQQGDDLVKR